MFYKAICIANARSPAERSKPAAELCQSCVPFPSLDQSDRHIEGPYKSLHMTHDEFVLESEKARHRSSGIHGRSGACRSSSNIFGEKIDSATASARFDLHKRRCREWLEGIHKARSVPKQRHPSRCYERFTELTETQRHKRLRAVVKHLACTVDQRKLGLVRCQPHPATGGRQQRFQKIARWHDGRSSRPSAPWGVSPAPTPATLPWQRRRRRQHSR